MSAEEDKAVVRRWIEAFNERDKRAEAEARAPGYLAHVPGESAPLDSEAWTRFLTPFEEAFPDLRIEVKEILSEGDLVAASVEFGGTHRGEFQGIPPTNKRVSFTGIEVNRMVDGKVEEHWVELDLLGMMQQLGLVVVPGPRLLGRMLVHQAKRLRSRLSARR